MPYKVEFHTQVISTKPKEQLAKVKVTHFGGEPYLGSAMNKEYSFHALKVVRRVKDPAERKQRRAASFKGGL